jgi:hypothetical protein
MHHSTGPEHRTASIPLALPDGTQGWASGITSEGMYVRPGVSLRAGQVLVMELRLPGSPLLFAVEGVVVRPDTGERGSQGALVRFTHKQLRSLR